MRTTDERVAAVLQRTKELEKQHRQRRDKIISLCSTAACLAIIIGIGLAIPDVMKAIVDNTYAYSGAAASMFYENGALGYILIGVLAFALGISVTLLSILLRRKQKREKEDDKRD